MPAIWELNRRTGLDFPLRPPEAAIPPEEDAVSIDAAIAKRDQFAEDSPAVLAVRRAVGVANGRRAEAVRRGLPISSSRPMTDEASRLYRRGALTV